MSLAEARMKALGELPRIEGTALRQNATRAIGIDRKTYADLRPIQRAYSRDDVARCAAGITQKRVPNDRLVSPRNEADATRAIREGIGERKVRAKRDGLHRRCLSVHP